MSFCPSCSQCPQCCQKAECRGQFTEVLAKVAIVGCESKGGFYFERRLFPTIQDEAPSHQISSDSEWLCKPSEEAVSKGGLVPKPNNKWCPILDLSQLNLYLSSGTFKMETPETIRLSLQQG